MNISPWRVLTELNKHIGQQNGVTVKQLTQALCGGACSESQMRDVRLAVQTLRERGHAVCALPCSGYFLAATEEEIERTCNFLKSRALTSLQQVSQLNKQALPAIIGQLGLELTQQEQPT